MSSVRNTVCSLLIASFIPVAFASGAGNRYVKEKERGWFWYEEPPIPLKEEKKEELKMVQTPPPPQKQVAKKSGNPWEVKPHKDTIQPLQLFFENPAKNAKKYLGWLSGVSDRAMQMAAAVEGELRRDPSLFTFTTPATTYASSHLKKFQAAAESKIVEKNKKRFGIIVFLREDCKICELQVSTLNMLYANGFEVLGITPDGLPVKGTKFPIEGDNGLAEKMEVQAVPCTFIVDSTTNKHDLIRVGLMPYYEFEASIISVLEKNGEWSAPERIEPWNKNNPKFNNIARHGFNPFFVYDEMQDELRSGAGAVKDHNASENATKLVQALKEG